MKKKKTPKILSLHGTNFNEAETAQIETFKNHISYLQKEIDEHWNMLTKNLKIESKSPAYDWLWDYVMNDFS